MTQRVAATGDDFLGAFAMVVRDGRYLFVANERHVGGRLVRTWDLPGGRVEPGEMLHEALRRELREETGLEVVSEPRLRFLQEGERLVDGARLYAWRSFFFAVEASGEPVASAEVHDVCWMAHDEIEQRCRAPYHDSFREWLRVGGDQTHFLSRWVD